jgi:hypothetical protein
MHQATDRALCRKRYALPRRLRSFGVAIFLALLSVGLLPNQLWSVPPVEEAIGPCPTSAHSIFLPLTIKDGIAEPTGFALNMPSCRIIVSGYTGAVELAITAPPSFTGQINLSLENIPTGITGAFTPDTIMPGQAATLSLTAQATVAPGSYSLNVKGVANTIAHVMPLTLIVVEPVIVNGRIKLDSGSNAGGAAVHLVTKDNQAAIDTTTTADGTFTAALPVLTIPTKILVQASMSRPGEPEVTNAQWHLIDQRGNVTVPPMLLADPLATEATLLDGHAQTEDGEVQVAGLPPEVTRFFAEAYDPDAERDAFPGEFAEEGRIPLESAGFVWMEALNGNGVEVASLAQPVTVRQRIPSTQWADLEDLTPDSERIEIPIYSFDEQANVWRQENTGWLEDSYGLLLSEDDHPAILAGIFTGEVYAAYTTTHFSWTNVDYPYVGPWRLGTFTDRTLRNNDCFYESLKLATEIARSPKGRAAYAIIANSLIDVDALLADGNGPGLTNAGLTTSDDPNDHNPILMNSGRKITGGEYPRHEAELYFWTSSDAFVAAIDFFQIDNGHWQGYRFRQPDGSIVPFHGCSEELNAEQKKKAILLMTTTILHETAHWIAFITGQVKCQKPGNAMTCDEDLIEAGKRLEEEILGGKLGIDKTTGELTINDQPISPEDLDKYLDPTYWRFASQTIETSSVSADRQQSSPLTIAIAMEQGTFTLGEEIQVRVKYRNSSDEPIQVLQTDLSTSHPLFFLAQRVGDPYHIAYGGSLIYLTAHSNEDRITLQADEVFEFNTSLIGNWRAGDVRYLISRPGSYTLTAVYSGYYGLPETRSNTLSFMVSPAGAISGVVTSITNTQPISGALVRVYSGNARVGRTLTGSDGSYAFPAVPTGIYTLTARAPYFFLDTQQNIQVTTGATTTVDLSLVPTRITYGQAIADKIEAPGQAITYTFMGVAGDKVIAFLNGPAVDEHIQYLRIYRPNRTLLCTLPLRLPTEGICDPDVDGPYLLVVADFNGVQTRPYSFYLQRLNNPAGAAPIIYGDTVTGSLPIAPGANVYTINGQSGHTLIIRAAELGDTAFQPEVRLYRPDGSQSCATWGASLAELPCTLDTTGLHTLFVRDQDSQHPGSYALYVQRIDAPVNAVSLNYGDTVSATLETPAQLATFVFTGTLGDVVWMRAAELVDTNFGPYLRLYRLNGTEVCSGFIFVWCPLDIDSVHAITVGDQMGTSAGIFAFHLQQLNDPANSIPLTTTSALTGSIDLVSQANLYTFTASADTSFNLTVEEATNTNFTIEIWVFRSDGTFVCSAWNEFHVQSLNCGPLNAGDYTILIQDRSGQNTGSYTLTFGMIDP